jgi:hypothetical protein
MSIKTNLKEALALAGGRDGHPRWWLAPDGELKPCSEHEYAAREILRGLKLTPAPGRALYDQMFSHGWVRVVREKSRLCYETSRSISREANKVQLCTLKKLSIECGVELYNLMILP